jgi:hypothetical protein
MHLKLLNLKLKNYIIDNMKRVWQILAHRRIIILRVPLNTFKKYNYDEMKYLRQNNYCILYDN